MVSNRIGAARYLECSAQDSDSVLQVFRMAGLLAINTGDRKHKLRGLRRLLGRDGGWDRTVSRLTTSMAG